jgi:hypothetical protein
MNAASPTHGSTIGEKEETSPSIGSSEIGGTTMCSPMLTVQAAPTSASLAQDACCDICPPVHEKYEAEFSPLHMNWVLVDGTKGNPRAHMRWMGDR